MHMKLTRTVFAFLACASTITLFDTGGTQIFSGIYNGDSTGSEGGDHLFIGLGDITGPNIGAIVIRP